ncbi:7376_t:CDS:2 [Cetraspora pellucida]|uniref:7376_t:CDS:1 n=1 Tax=Cetraspora pellucida TaxID=1433469 RepID=A0A9N9NG71_9GLOM|nr:7376_t:CDS:2 [Cetraspora pellucida]
MCVTTKQAVVIIALLWMCGGIVGAVQNYMLLSDPYLYEIGSTGHIALVINCLTVAITLFGLFAVNCGQESVQSLKIFSGLFILAVILHLIYAIYFIIVVSSNGILGSYPGITIYLFVGPLIGAYFAKIIADYTKIVELRQQNVQTPGRVEASNTTNNQVVNQL